MLQIILIGQPELTEKLSRPELRQLNLRITARYNLQPLNLQETTAYIRHRLRLRLADRRKSFRVGGGQANSYLTRGIPRLINVLCDRALLGAYGQQRSRVNKKLIAEAAAEVFGERAALPISQSSLGKRAWLVFLVAVASAAVGYWVSQLEVSESNTSARAPAADLSSDLSARPNASVSGTDNGLLGDGSTQLLQQSPVISRNKLGNEVNAGIADGGFSQPQGSADFERGVTAAAPVWELGIQGANERFWQAASNTRCQRPCAHRLKSQA